MATASFRAWHSSVPPPGGVRAQQPISTGLTRLTLTRRLLSLENLSSPQDQLYKEMRGRIQEADQSAPIRWVNKWWSAAPLVCVTRGVDAADAACCCVALLLCCCRLCGVSALTLLLRWLDRGQTERYATPCRCPAELTLGVLHPRARVRCNHIRLGALLPHGFSRHCAGTKTTSTTHAPWRALSTRCTAAARWRPARRRPQRRM